MYRVQYERWSVISDFHHLLFPKPVAGKMGIVRMFSKPGDDFNATQLLSSLSDTEFERRL
jgi:hypothetical protein